MRTVEIYILGKKIDLFEDTVVATTYQSADIGSTEDILMSFTRTIKVPRTPTNDLILGFANILSSNETQPYRKLPATVRRNGIEILSDGLAIIKGFSGNYSMNIFGGNYGLFNVIGELTLQDLTLSDLDHDRTLAVIAESTFDGTAGDYDYMYPLVQWGQDVTMSYLNFTINAERLYPCIKLSRIVTQIVEGAGYELATNLNNIGEPFASALIPVMHKKSSDDTDTQYEEAGASFESTTTMTSFVAQSNKYIALFTVKTYHQEWQVEDIDWTAPAEISWYYTQFNILSTGKYEIDIRITFNGLDEDTYVVKLVTYLEHPITYTSWVDEYLVLAEDSCVTSLIGSTVCSFSFSGRLGRGERVALVVERPSLSAETPCEIIGGALVSYVNFTLVESETTEYGFNFPIAVNLPELKQVDLLKDVAVRWGLMYYTNPMTRKFYMYTIDDVKNNIKGSSIDWSDKLDLNTTPKIGYANTKYAQENWFRNAKEDTMSHSGDWSFTIDDENLDVTKKVYTSIFGSSDEIILYYEISMVEILRYNAVEEYLDKEPKPRIIMLLSDTVAASLEYRSDLEGDSHITVGGSEKIAVGVFLNLLHMGDPNLSFRYTLNTFYISFIEMLDRYKHVTANFLLTEVDIANVNPIYPIYVREFGVYFYLSKINNSTGGSDSVELIKL